MAALAAVLAPRAAQAQIVSLPPSRDPQFHNAIGIAGSVGPFIGRDAHFWGLAIDYTRRLQHGWSIGGSIAWDEDRERRQDGSRKVVHAFNAVVTVNYSFNIFTVTTGLSRGFASDDNESGRMELAAGDWGTGLVFGVALPDLPWTSRDTLSFSVGYEYNLSQREPDVSFDVGIGYAF